MFEVVNRFFHWLQILNLIFYFIYASTLVISVLLWWCFTLCICFEISRGSAFFLLHHNINRNGYLPLRKQVDCLICGYLLLLLFMRKKSLHQQISLATNVDYIFGRLDCLLFWANYLNIIKRWRIVECKYCSRKSSMLTSIWWNICCFSKSPIFELILQIITCRFCCILIHINDIVYPLLSLRICIVCSFVCTNLKINLKCMSVFEPTCTKRTLTWYKLLPNIETSCNSSPFCCFFICMWCLRAWCLEVVFCWVGACHLQVVACLRSQTCMLEFHQWVWGLYWSQLYRLVQLREIYKITKTVDTMREVNAVRLFSPIPGISVLRFVSREFDWFENGRLKFGIVDGVFRKIRESLHRSIKSWALMLLEPQKSKKEGIFFIAGKAWSSTLYSYGGIWKWWGWYQWTCSFAARS